MEKFDRSKEYKPKRRHGNRLPVVPVYTRPNSVRVINAAMRMTAAYNKPEYDEAAARFWKEIDRMDKQLDHIDNVINYLDNQID